MDHDDLTVDDIVAALATVAVVPGKTVVPDEGNVVPVRAPRGRRARQELRLRVRNLHVELDRLGGHVTVDERVEPDPLTIASVMDALRRFGGSSTPDVVERAVRLAMWARDPSLPVRAYFAAERVIIEALPTAAALATEPWPIWHDGQPVPLQVRDVPPQVALFGDITALLERQDDILTHVAGDGIIEANANNATLGWAADAVRPPAEALVLVAALVEPHAQRQVLVVDLGHDAAHSLLSALIPNATITACGTVFRMSPDEAPNEGKPDLAVVNLASETARRWSRIVVDELLDGGVRHRLLRDLRDWAFDHEGNVEEVVELVASVLVPGVILALLVDASTGGAAHADLVRVLRDRGLDLVPHTQGLDGDRRAVLVRYANRPWTPMGVPSPTDRLVSIWKVV